MKKNKFNTSSNLFNTLTFLKKKKCKKEEKIQKTKKRGECIETIGSIKFNSHGNAA